MEILLIDDHTLFREALCHVLRQLDADMRIHEAAGEARAMKLISGKPSLDLVILDLFLPGTDGFALLDSICKDYPALPVVIISSSDHPKDIKRAMAAGASGYIPKNTTSSIMLNALRLIFSGGIYTPPSTDDLHGHDLTPRQLDVFDLLAEGCSNKMIAARLGLSEATVKMHVTAILKSLSVSNRTQAAMMIPRNKEKSAGR